MEVHLVDQVVVDDREGADAGGGEDRQHRAAQTTGANHDGVRAREPRLRGVAEAGQDPLACVARGVRIGRSCHPAILPPIPGPGLGRPRRSYSATMSTGADPLTFCCLLWAQPGAADGLHAYEDVVLELFADHGAVVLERAIGDGADGQPVEVQILSFPHQAALDGYIADPRRTNRLGERDRVVARTEFFPVRRPQSK